jgi:hypothetical protein
MDFTSFRFSYIKEEIETFLKKEYNKASLLFSNASPYGQILSVLENLHQLSFLYLKNSINSFDMSFPNASNTRTIRNTAINAGHIPSRSISATGTLQVKVKPAADLETEIRDSKITIPPRLLMRNKTNGLTYCVDIGKLSLTYKITKNTSFFLSIIQGEWKSKSYTGAGEPIQSFSVSEMAKDIENFHVQVLVDYESWEVKRSIYDMYPDEKAVVVRTGYNNGIEVIFGNGSFGMMPPLGSNITVRYILTDGSLGNIFRRTPNDWSIIGDVTDGSGFPIAFERLFDVYIYNDINFGSEGESISFTRSLLPFVTNNAVLALPQHFTYEIKKLGVFSYVSAYEKSGTIYITVTPNVNLFKNKSQNYFTVDLGAFELDSYEKKKIDMYLRSNGLIMLTKKYIISSPKLSFYAVNIFIMTYSDSLDDSVNSLIINSISTYFFNLTRISRIPKADIVKILSFVDDIHSVDIQFVCKKNEDYHKDQIMKMNKQMNGFGTNPNGQPYDPNQMVGLDPVFGDILFEEDEIPIMRGGWYDRNGAFYSDDIESNGLKAVNIFKQGVIDAKKRP